MQDAYSTKTGERASLSRRTFMSLAASSAALTIPAVTPTEGYAKPPTAASLQSLLDAHAKATKVASDLWERVADIEENRFRPHSVAVRVRYAWRIRGWIDDETGESAKTPLYAYNDEEIEEVCRTELQFRLNMVPESNIEARQHFHEMCELRIVSLTSELANLQKVMDRLADECGLTAAEDAAKSATDCRTELADTISYYMPATLHEAALLAEWVMHVAWHDDCDLLYVVLGSIARAGGIVSGPQTKAMISRGEA